MKDRELNIFFGRNYRATEIHLNIEPEVTPEEPKSLYERLCKLSDELKRYGAPTSFTNELNSLAEEVDEIDSAVLKEKAHIIDTIDRLTVAQQLGEISKRLY